MKQKVVLKGIFSVVVSVVLFSLILERFFSEGGTQPPSNRKPVLDDDEMEFDVSFDEFSQKARSVFPELFSKDRSEFMECEYSTECERELDCISGLCVRDGLPNGYYCLDDWDCLSNQCTRSRCTVPDPDERKVVEVPVYFPEKNSAHGTELIEFFNEMVKDTKLQKYSIIPKFVRSFQYKKTNGKEPIFIYFQLCDKRSDIDFFWNDEDHKTAKLKNILLPAYNSHDKYYFICGRTTRKLDCDLGYGARYDMDNIILSYRNNSVFSRLYSDDLIEVTFSSKQRMNEICNKFNLGDQKIRNFVKSVMIHLVASSYQKNDPESRKMKSCLQIETEKCGENVKCTNYISKCFKDMPLYSAPTAIRNNKKEENKKNFEVCFSDFFCKGKVTKGTLCKNIYQENKKLRKELIKVCIPEDHFSTNQLTGGGDHPSKTYDTTKRITLKGNPKEEEEEEEEEEIIKKQQGYNIIFNNILIVLKIVLKSLCLVISYHVSIQVSNHVFTYNIIIIFWEWCLIKMKKKKKVIIIAEKCDNKDEDEVVKKQEEEEKEEKEKEKEEEEEKKEKEKEEEDDDDEKKKKE